MPPKESQSYGYGGQVFRTESEFEHYLRLFLSYHSGLPVRYYDNRNMIQLLQQAERGGLCDIQEWPSLAELSGKGKGKGKGKGNDGNDDKGKKGKGRKGEGKGPY